MPQSEPQPPMQHNAPATPAVVTPSRQPAATDSKPKPWHWNVVLLDDDDHSYDYVVRMLQELFGRSREDAYLVAETVDTQGRAILMTTHREHAELKREQIIAFGRDPLMQTSKGPMSAVLEPVH